MIILINGNTYEGNQSIADVTIQIAKDAVRGSGFGIVAVQKDDMVEMKKDMFPSKVELYTRKKEYEDAGFKVYLVDRGLTR